MSLGARMFDPVIEGLSWVVDMFSGAFGMGARLAPLYLASFVGIAYLVWLWQGRSGRFLGWLFPRSVYFHRSSVVDVQIFILGRILAVTGFFGSMLVPAVVAKFVLATLIVLFAGGYEAPPVTPGRILLATFLIVLTLDFCTYWVHRLHHETSVLWPFHSLHHSAEVLTPITVYRKHPVYDLIAMVVRSVLVGAMQGVVLFAVVGSVDLLTIGGANAFYVAFNLLGSNLRHSHVWLSYGPVLERIFISPAQHQIHHSRAVEHHNKNYGEIFAFWDWMFGTLYVPTRREVLEFGLSDAAGRPIEQPHGTLAQAMIRPFRDSGRALRSLLRPRVSGQARRSRAR